MRPLRAIAAERLLKLAPTFHRHNDYPHPVALGENELLDFPVHELSEQEPKSRIAPASSFDAG